MATDGPCRGLFYIWFNVETNVGDDADRIIAVGLLAISSVRETRPVESDS